MKDCEDQQEGTRAHIPFVNAKQIHLRTLKYSLEEERDKQSVTGLECTSI